MDHHWHWGIENILFIGFAAAVVRYLMMHLAAILVPSGGAIGQFGAALGGIFA